MSLKEKLVNHFHEVAKTKDSPFSIALGFAIGTFIGVMPTPGFGLLIAVLLALIFKQINKYSLFIALAIFNPLVLAPVYLISYKIGNLILGTSPIVTFTFDSLYGVILYSVRLLIGLTISAVFLSSISFVLAYFISKRLLNK